MKKSTKNILNITVFAVIALLTLWFLVAKTFTPETFDALKLLGWREVAMLLGLWLIARFSDNLSVLSLARGLGESMHPRLFCSMSFVRCLFDSITPFAFGGQPFMIMLMTKYGFKPGRATSIIFTKLAIMTIAVFCVTMGSLVWYWNYISGWLLPLAFILTSFLSLLFCAMIISALLKPQFVLRFIMGALGLWQKFMPRSFIDPLKIRRRVVKELILIRTSFHGFFASRRGMIYLIISSIIILLCYVVQVAAFWVILYLLGLHIPFGLGFAACALGFFIFSFIPTPGASGFGEAMLVAIYSGLVPLSYLGLTIIIWRFFITYLTCFVAVPITYFELKR